MDAHTPATDVPLLLAPGPVAEPTAIDVPTDVTVVQLRRTGVGLADLPSIFDSGYAVLAALGPAGPGFAIYDGDVGGGQPFDLTIGFPVATVPDDLPDGVEVGTFPGGRALVVSHVGPFDALPQAWEALIAHPSAIDGDRSIEIYADDPSVTPEDRVRTDLLLPLP